MTFTFNTQTKTYYRHCIPCTHRIVREEGRQRQSETQGQTNYATLHLAQTDVTIVEKNKFYHPRIIDLNFELFEHKMQIKRAAQRMSLKNCMLIDIFPDYGRLKL